MAPHGRSPRHRRKSRAAPPVESGPDFEAEDPKPSGAVRVQKLLAAAGLASRRGAEELISQGRVEINGRVAKLGDVADPAQDKVTLDGEGIGREPLGYWILNKPTGVLTTVRDPHGRPTVLDHIPASRQRLFPVGRLDQDTSGLVLLTNDGSLAQKLLHPSLESEKEYRVTVKGEVAEKTLARLEKGVFLEEGVMTAPARVKGAHYDRKADHTSFSLILTEGRKRQIRVSMLRLGHPVKRLVRVRIGPVRLGPLSIGEARELSGAEVTALREHVAKLRPKSRRRSPRRRRATPDAS